MRILPKVEDVSYLLQPHRKDLSQNHIDKLEKKLSQLENIQGEDKAHALFQIGIINAYLNRFEIAAQNYLESYKLDNNEVSYGNYLFSIAIIKGMTSCFDIGFSFLEKHPNNLSFLKNFLSLLRGCYAPKSHLEVFKKYINLHKSDERVYSELTYLYEEAKSYQIDIQKTNCPPKIFNCLVNLATVEFIKLFAFSPMSLHKLDDDNCYFIHIVNLPKCEDIITLNDNYEEAVSRAIEKGDISFDEYADSASQVVVMFSAWDSERLVA